jgi:myo-inositol-1(or 4)-monophosphatase
VDGSLAADLALLEEAAEAAATVALAYFKQEQQVWTKEGGSPVSEADYAVDRKIAEVLRGARPDYGWQSEEGAEDPERLGRVRVFVVDPIDGTRAFLAGGKEWTISIAVVEDEMPVAAVLVGPAMAVSFTATAGGGAFRNGARLVPSRKDTTIGARFASSRRYAKAVAEGGSGHPPRYVHSLAYRLALVASGEIDVAIAKANARDWDLAAADLLVHEAGACLADLSGRKVRYNTNQTIHPTLVAANPALFGAVADLVRKVDGEAT